MQFPANTAFGAPRRAAAIALAALLHGLVILLLVTQSAELRVTKLPVLPVRLLPAPRPPPLRPRTLRPVLAAPPIPVPVPEVRVSPPASASHAIRSPAPTAHFAPAAGDAGLGLDLAASSGGGTAARGSLGDFEAAVKRRILARKRQPTLAWDRRNTCIVNYAVRVTPSGGLAGFRIDPCAVPEINAAARTAIAEAAPFPPPPALGAAATEVHGTLIFRP